jgi:hypothetical protein
MIFMEDSKITNISDIIHNPVFIIIIIIIIITIITII